MEEDNTVFVLQQALRRFNIKVSDTSVKEFLLAHPYYPSLKSVCDALKKWGIEHYPLKLEIAEIKELELPFIAHFNNSGGLLVFVEEIKNGEVKYFLQKGKSQHETFVKFAEKLSGALVLIEPGQKIQEVNYKQNRQNEILKSSLLPLGIITILTFATFSFFSIVSSGIQSEFVFWGLLFTKIIGIVASLFLVLHELKIHTPLGDKLCGFSSKTDCDAVLGSNASRMFGSINWADAGVIYFIGTIIYFLGSDNVASLGLLAILSAVSLPYPVFSIYYQSFKLKKWCPFCLMVQLVLIGEFLILLPIFQEYIFSFINLFRLATAFLLPAAIWILFKAYREKLVEQLQEHYLFLKLKRNPDLFRFLLKSNGNTELAETMDSIVLGNPDAPVTLTAFLSLYCKPCALAFKKMKVLLDNCPDIRINAVFSVYRDEETQHVINTLYYLYATKGTDPALKFLDQWYTHPAQLLKTLDKNDTIPEHYEVAERIRDTNNHLYAIYQIAGTPTIYVNGYKFPEQYEYSDLEYYIEDIKQLTRESKRQEACVISN